MGSDSVCERQWTKPCPDGWDHTGNSVCVAPASYTISGACRHTQTFTHADARTKLEFSASCAAPWPCDGDACNEGRDYESCPTGWADIGDGFCRAPSNVETKCEPTYKFSEIPISTKQELAIACGIEWPCKSSCAPDYRRACPEGWTEVAGMCAAPVTYSGDCSYSMNTTGMAEKQRSIGCEVRSQISVRMKPARGPLDKEILQMSCTCAKSH